MIDMSTEATTIMGREEVLGKPYPLWIERVFILAAVFAFVFFSADVNAAVDHDVLGPMVAYIAYPLALLAAVELVGRLLQQIRTS
jgi:hypothetical protein